LYKERNKSEFLNSYAGNRNNLKLYIELWKDADNLINNLYLWEMFIKKFNRTEV